MDGNTVVFHTKSGILKANKVSGYQEFDGPPPDERDPKPAKRRQPSDKGVVELDFPSSPPTACSDSSLLSEALGGVEIRWVGRSDVGDYLVRIPHFYYSVGVDVPFIGASLFCIARNVSITRAFLLGLLLDWLNVVPVRLSR